MLRKFFENEKGGAMLMAIMGLAIISIFTMAAIFMGSTNARQTQREGKRTQAYYVADAGAKSVVEKLKTIKPEKLKEELNKMVKKGKIKGKYEEWEFDIEIVEDSEYEDKYEIRTTGEVNGVIDGTVAILSLDKDEGGGGYNMGDGKIFMTGNDDLEIAYMPQLSESGISLYTANKLKHDLDDRPIKFTQGDFSKLFRDRSDRGGGNNEELNEQYEMAKSKSGKELGNYHLKIKDVDGNYIKREIIERKDEEKKKGDKKIELNYDMEKEMILDYFSREQLPKEGIKKDKLEEAISDIFLLPINTVEEYNKYIKDNDKVFPSVEHYNPKGDSVDKLSFSDSKFNKLNTKEQVDITGKEDLVVDQKLVIKENGDLTILTSGDTNISLNKGLEMSEGGQLTIIADGTVNVYIKNHAQPDGNITVKKPGGEGTQANFYINKGTSFQTNNKSEVKGVNLYAPDVNIQLQNEVVWEGILIGKEVQFKDNATFRAPSAGSSSSDMNSEDTWSLKPVEWREWKGNK